ncbi:hypothetical protein IGI37_001567 [Enterococcus sp. AZ194]
MKEKLSLFNQFSSPVRESIIYLLMAHNQTGDQNLDELLEDYEQIVVGGFRRSAYTYFASYLLQFSEAKEKGYVIQRAKEIYKTTRINHPILTGEEDAPAAISLAQSSQLASFTAQMVSDIMEKFYIEMHRIGFAKGDELQFAAGTATLLFQGYNNSIIDEMAEIIQQFNQYKLPFKRKLIQVSFI